MIINNLNTTNLSTYLGVIVLSLAVFFPALSLGESLPTIHVLDFCFPVFLFLIVQKKGLLSKSWYFILPFIFGMYVLFTILIQGHSTMRHDYFELYKWFKYGVTILFFTQVNFQFFKRVIPYLVGILFLVNTLHFFDVFKINELLEKYYNGGIHIQFFGKNSLGEPAVKRLVGTMGNPNINAILFGMTSIYFLPVTFHYRKVALFLMSLLFMFLCQSRTSLLILAAMLFVILFFYSRIWTKKQWFILLLGIVLSFILAWMLTTSFFKYTSYSNSLLDGSAINSGSARGRFETWKLLFSQILEYPIFGRGPYKIYFYANQLYSENEYILMLWRYGIVGFFFYITIYLIPFRDFFRGRRPEFIQVLLLVILMMVSALTNNPLTERNIELLFCIGLAWGYQRYFEKG